MVVERLIIGTLHSSNQPHLQVGFNCKKYYAFWPNGPDSRPFVLEVPISGTGLETASLSASEHDLKGDIQRGG
jgi:hypothetical protein